MYERVDKRVFATRAGCEIRVWEYSNEDERGLEDDPRIGDIDETIDEK